MLSHLLVFAGQICDIPFPLPHGVVSPNVSWSDHGGIPRVLLNVRGSESGSIESAEDKKGERASSSGREPWTEHR